MDFLILRFPFQKLKASSRLLIYGLGKLGLQLSRMIEEKGVGTILGFIDQRSAERGSVRGYPVADETCLSPSLDADFIVVASNTHRSAMLGKLLKLGIPEEKILTFEALPVGDSLTTFGRVTFCADGFCTTHNADFQRQEPFQRAYQKALETKSWVGNIQWRAHTLCWAGKQAMNLPGDFVECGVNKGGTSRLVMEYVDFRESSKRFFLLDTFEGLVREQLTPEEIERDLLGWNDRYADGLVRVQETFRDFPNVVILPGKVPDTLPLVNADQIAFLSIDMNCAYPEQAALHYFWPKMVPGGIVVLDDYGHSGHEAQKTAMDAFAAGVQKEILSLPTGQGVLIK